MELEFKFSDCQFSAFKNNVLVKTLAFLKNITDKGLLWGVPLRNTTVTQTLSLINLGYHYFRLQRNYYFSFNTIITNSLRATPIWLLPALHGSVQGNKVWRPYLLQKQESIEGSSLGQIPSSLEAQHQRGGIKGKHPALTSSPPTGSEGNPRLSTAQPLTFKA